MPSLTFDSKLITDDAFHETQFGAAKTPVRRKCGVF